MANAENDVRREGGQNVRDEKNEAKRLGDVVVSLFVVPLRRAGEDELDDDEDERSAGFVGRHRVRFLSFHLRYTEILDRDEENPVSESGEDTCDSEGSVTMVMDGLRRC